MCPCCSPHNAQGAHCTGELLLYMQILSWDTVWLRLRGSHHVTITSAFSSQYWIRWPLNSYFLIVCKKYRTVPLLSSPVRCPPVSQSTAHIYANPPFSNFHHQLGVLLVAGWASLVWLVPLIINLEIKTKARLAAAAVSGPTPAPAPTLGEYTI